MDFFFVRLLCSMDWLFLSRSARDLAVRLNRVLLGIALVCGLSLGSSAWAGNVGVGAKVGLGYLYCLSGAAPLMCANGPDAVAEMTIAGVNSKMME
ncbi:hypothetical protein [Ralstonia solanacearum]|uniref:hypothetical protein n=2 Tax=Ralstonia solanacearum TaxID=305 RepID=UPI0018D1AC1D|nr:hypothetical protein [Ralstonia solanacearum]